MTRYSVTAKHPCDKDQTNFKLAVHEDKTPYGVGFYAMNALLGCSKTYRSEVEAVSALVHDHAYAIRKIEKL